MLFQQLSTWLYNVSIMKIGLISDTRIAGNSGEVPREVTAAFQGVDLILHAGGIHTPRVLDWLEQIAPVKAVGRIHGGQAERPTPFAMESGEDPRVADRQILQLEGHTIGMINHLDLPWFSDDIFPGVIQASTITHGYLKDILRDFFGEQIDIAVFGRTLYHLVEEHEGILFVNPGSPSLPRNLMKLGNVAILELSPGARSATIIELSDYS